MSSASASAPLNVVDTATAAARPTSASEPIRPITRVYLGTIIHSLSLQNLVVLDPGVLGVTDDGRIAFCEAVFRAGAPRDHDHATAIRTKLDSLRASFGFNDSQIHRLPPTQLLIPGFIDTHIHASQFVYAGTGTDLPLLEWLEKYTFPREAAYADAAYARQAYSRAVRRSARCGTTTACYFATIHADASHALAIAAAELGQRCFVGKVCMDRHAPDYYVESTVESMDETVRFLDAFEERVSKVHPHATDLVKPVLTPRFAPTCTAELMRFLGDLARDRDLTVQTHLNENKKEVRWVSELHPECASYTAVYDAAGLLTRRTVLAHCVHMTDAELELIASRGSGVSHCPVSNFTIMSGSANVRRMISKGVRVSIGTDVAGGYSSSVHEAMRAALVASKVIAYEARQRAEGAEGYSTIAEEKEVWEPLGYSEAFYLGTLGGAEVLGIEDKVGNFAPGKDFDALLINLEGTLAGNDEVAPEQRGLRGDATVNLFPHDDVVSQFEKFFFLGDDRNIAEVWVKGRKLVFA